jgi:hypothetical protein
MRAACSSNLILHDLNILIYTWWNVQNMKLLVMQFPPTSRHFISLRSKYSSQHPVSTSQTQIKSIAAVPSS